MCTVLNHNCDDNEEDMKEKKKIEREREREREREKACIRSSFSRIYTLLH